MSQIRWSVLALMAIVLVQVVVSSPVDVEVFPAEQIGLSSDAVFGPELPRGDREKRKILESVVAGSLGAKNYLINLIFGKLNQAIDHKTRVVSAFDRTNVQKNLAWGIGGGPAVSKSWTTTTRPAAPTTPDDIPEFDRNAVALDIPSEVIGSSFSLITRVSRIVGSVIQNSAERTQRFVEALKPIFGKKFGITTSRSPRQSYAVDADGFSNDVDATS